jgi:RNA polymerase sigma factor for flagellar operon FliA
LENPFARKEGGDMSFLEDPNSDETHSLDGAPATGGETPRSLDDAVRAYMPLVRHVVHRLISGAAGAPILDYDDLVSFGMQGLIEAYHGFDPGRGVKFTTFALPRIRGCILDAMRKAHPLPRSLQRLSHRIEDTATCLTTELGRAPTHFELADRLGISPEELSQSAKTIGVKTLSLEKLAEMAANGAVEKLIEVADDDLAGQPEQSIEDHLTRAELGAAIENLPDRERVIIKMYYLRSRSLRSIAGVLGISESRVSQLRHRAVVRLRGALLSGLAKAA